MGQLQSKVAVKGPKIAQDNFGSGLSTFPGPQSSIRQAHTICRIFNRDTASSEDFRPTGLRGYPFSSDLGDCVMLHLRIISHNFVLQLLGDSAVGHV